MNSWRSFWAGVNTLTSVIESSRAVPEVRPAIIEAASPAIQCIVIEKRSAVRFEAVVVKNDIAVIPVTSPVVKSPAKPAKETNAKP
jgi:hypothetical protein